MYNVLNHVVCAFDDPFIVENYAHGVHYPKTIGHYSFSYDYFTKLPADNKTTAIFHVRPKGAPRTKFFNNFTQTHQDAHDICNTYGVDPTTCHTGVAYLLPPAPSDKREFPCSKCDEGELMQEGFTQPNGTLNYRCNYCGHIESYP